MKRLPRTLTHPAVVSAIVALALTGLLYGDALTLPLFSDDLVQIPWLESLSWRELWTGPSPYGYYRPLWYSLWRLWGALTGGLHPLGLHALNLAAHFAAAWLAGLLAGTWTPQGAGKPRFYIAALAAALCAVFPFSRQAVAWPGAVYNPLVSAMAAGAVLAYDRGRQGCGQRWFGLALLLAGLAPLTYEAGLLVGPLVILTEGLGRLLRRWPGRSRWPLAFGGLFLAAFALWRAMRGTGVAGFGLAPASLHWNAAYLVQGLVYPVAPLAQQLVAQFGIAPEAALWIVALPALALLAWYGLRWNQSAFGLGVAWFALFALPPAVSMEADWFALAPRFLYMTACGAALIWTAAAAGWLSRLRLTWRLPAAALLIAALLPAAAFVRDGVRLYEMAGESLWDAAQAAERKQPLLLVNLPLRIAPAGRLYPLGFEGVTPLPMRVTADEIVTVNSGRAGAAEAVALGVAAAEKPSGYTYQLFGRQVGWKEIAAAIRQSQTVYLTKYEPERIHLVEAGSASETPPGEPLAHFGEQITLLGAECTCDGSGRVRLKADWQVRAAVESDVTVFAHLLNQEGAAVTQADGYPLLGTHPFWFWEPGEAMQDVRYFAPVPAGEYTVRIGIWEPASGEQWAAEEWVDGVVLLPVRCP